MNPDKADELVVIGQQADQTVTADELAGLLGTVNYEVVTAISQRVPRVAVAGSGGRGDEG